MSWLVGQRVRAHQTVLPPPEAGRTPQARASCSTSHNPLPPSASRSGVTGRNRRGPRSRTEMNSRSPRSSSFNHRPLWAWITALVTSSLATSTARSTTVASGVSSRQDRHTSRTKIRAARAAVGTGASRSSSRSDGGRARAASIASSTVAYSRVRWAARPRRSASATCGRAPHNRKLVAGQRAAGCLAAVENTAAAVGSR